METGKTLQDVLNNEAFLDELFSASNPEALMRLLNGHDIHIEDMSPEDLFGAVQRAKSAELGEADLENVSGGAVLPLIAVAGPFVPGVGWVLAGSAFAAALAYHAYRKYKKQK